MSIIHQFVCDSKPATRSLSQSPPRRASRNRSTIGPAGILIGMATVAGVFTSSLPAKAHRVVLLTEGEVVEEATPGVFFFNPSLERTRRFLEQIR